MRLVVHGVLKDQSNDPPDALDIQDPDYALSSVTERLIGDPEIHFVS
jgi:hypothetical protein